MRHSISPRPRALILPALFLVVVLAALVIHRRDRGEHDRSSTVAPPPAVASCVTAGSSGDGVVRVEGSTKDWFIEQGAPIAVTGIVLRNGQAAGGIAVDVRDDLTSEGVLSPQRSVTDPEGGFVVRVPRIRGGRYRVSAIEPNLAPAVAFAPGDVTTNDIELRLEGCRARVYGTVSDASGGPVSGARVFLDSVPDHLATTDEHGSFDLCTPLRQDLLRVEAEGYGGSWMPISPLGALRQDVALMPRASIVGIVVTSARPVPVPWALVSMRMGGELVRRLRADERGRFELSGIAPGSYMMEARSVGARSHHPIEVSVFASSSAHVSVPVDARVRVSGRIVRRDGPVARAALSLGFAGTFERATTVHTADDGSFVVDDAPPGDVLVTVDDHDVEDPKTLAVAETGLAGVTIRVAARGELRVHVTRQGAPVRDATVALRGPNAPSSKLTTSAGVASFRGLADATYRVIVEHETDFAVLESVRVDRSVPSDVALELTTGRQVTGRVVDERGRAVDGARVSFVSMTSAEDIGAAVVTGADGSFRGGPLRGPATYRAVVARSRVPLDPKSEFPALSVPASGPVVPASLVLVVKTQAEELSGIVVDPQGGPTRDARVVVSRPEPHADVLATTFTGDSGMFVLRGLGAGPYAVKAVAPSGSEAEVKPITLPSRPVRIELAPVSSIAGSIKGFSRTPTIMAWSIAGYDSDFHPALLDGERFTIDGLARGRYHVAASSPGAAAQATVTVDGVAPTIVELVASGKRTVRGRTLDFVSGGPLPNMTCQAAPDLGDTRSPVVVPGTVFSDGEGAFALVDVPATALYMWCMGDASFRGGAARIPAGALDEPITVWGLDVRGKPTIDIRALAMTFAEDHPFSRRISAVEPRGAAERSGILVGDVIERVGERSVADCGNGTVRNYLALVLTEGRSVPIVVSRGSTTLPLTFKLE
jgi:protocatechuate 3,4-dioxygenase beta subunit